MDKSGSKTIVCATCGHPNNISFGKEQNSYQCECCERIHPIPKDEEKYSTLYDRATSLRINNKFDRAIDTYNIILNQDDTNEEAHFWTAMCRYGVNYVKDEEGIYHPTCWNYQEEPILSDYDYRRALELAPPGTAEIYRSKAEEVNRIQRKIGRIIQTGKGYDAFICYKETDDNTGQRTPDSAKAEELYDALTAKGYRVFFAPRTFQATLVEEYEPYIYAAMYSAKNMYILASSRENAESKWVKNEWQRFIEFKKIVPEKVLRVLLLGMSPNELPSELANYQASDLNRLGVFEQICGELSARARPEEPQPRPRQEQDTPSGSYQALLERGGHFLGGSEFEKAYEYFDRALRLNAKLPEAYWGLLLAEHQCRDTDELIALGVCIDQDKNYRLACEYADASTASEYRNAAQMILRMEHVYIMHLIRNHESYRAALRAKDYGSSKLCDGRLAALHAVLTDKKAFTEFNSETRTAAALEALLEIYASDGLFRKLDEELRLTDTVKKDYDAYMERTFEIIEALGKRRTGGSLLEDIRTLALIWTKNIGERWLLLAEKLKGQDAFTDSSRPPEWPELVFGCYDEAVRAGEDKVRCEAAKRGFFELVLQRAEDNARLDFLSTKYPDDWQVYWKYVQLIMQANIPGEQLLPERDPRVEKALQMDLGRYMGAPEESAGEFEDAVARQEERIRDGEGLTGKLREEAGRYLERALACAGDQAVGLRKEWGDYIQSAEAVCEMRLRLFTEDLEKLKGMAADYREKYLRAEEKANRAAAARGIACTAASFLFLIAACCLTMYAWQLFQNPKRLLPHTTLGYTVPAVLISLAGGALLCFLQYRLGKIADHKRNSLKITKLAPLLIAVLTAAASAGSASLFVMAAAAVENSAEAVEIGTPEELAYISRHPGADFMITCDMDLSEEEWAVVGTLKGTLDGQGHCLSGISTDKPYLFKNNKGAIKNITFLGTETTAGEFSLAGSNDGTISGCTINGIQIGNPGGTAETPKRFYGFAAANYGSIQDCEVTGISGDFQEFAGIASVNIGSIRNCNLADVSGDFHEFAGIARTNRADGTIGSCKIHGLSLVIREDFGGAAGENEGSIADVEVAELSLEGGGSGNKIRYLAGACCRNRAGGTVSGCRVEGFAAENVVLACGGGLIAESEGTVSDCTVLELYVSGRAEGIYGGLIGICSGSVTRCVAAGNVFLAEADIAEGYISDIPWLVFGGLLGEQNGCEITHSASSVSLFADNNSVSYRGVTAGGISGIARETCAVRNSAFEGELDLAVAYGAKTTSAGSRSSASKYQRTNDYCVGGIVGLGFDAFTVENSYCRGRAAVRVTELNSSGDPAIRIGGFSSGYSDWATFLNSYSAMEIEAWFPEEQQNRLSSCYINNYVGGFVPLNIGAPSVQSCFFAGTFSYIEQGGKNCIPGFEGSPGGVVNAYVRENCGYKSTHYHKLFAPEKSFRTVSFLTDTLGWDSSVWDMNDGELPVLRDAGTEERQDGESEGNDNG